MAKTKIQWKHSIHCIYRVVSCILFLHVTTINCNLNNNINIFWFAIESWCNWKSMIMFSTFNTYWFDIFYHHICFSTLKNSYFPLQQILKLKLKSVDMKSLQTSMIWLTKIVLFVKLCPIIFVTFINQIWKLKNLTKSPIV